MARILKRPAGGRSGARQAGALSSFQKLQKQLDKETKEKNRGAKKVKALQAALAKEKKAKEKERVEKYKIQGELWAEREQQQDHVNDAVQSRLRSMGIVIPSGWWSASTNCTKFQFKYWQILQNKYNLIAANTNKYYK